MRELRFLCIGCHVLARSDATQLCTHCASDMRGLREVVQLILRKFPAMRGHTVPELMLRLWMRLDAVQRDPEALQAAEELQRKISARIISEPPKGSDPESRQAHEAFKEARKA